MFIYFSGIPAIGISTVARLTLSFTRRINVGIEQIKEMSMNTMSLSRINCRWGDTAQYVGLSRHRFQMVGICACSVAAQMVYLKTLGDWAFQKLVGKAMRHEFPLFTTTNLCQKRSVKVSGI